MRTFPVNNSKLPKQIWIRFDKASSVIRNSWIVVLLWMKKKRHLYSHKHRFALSSVGIGGGVSKWSAGAKHVPNCDTPDSSSRLGGSFFGEGITPWGQMGNRGKLSRFNPRQVVSLGTFEPFGAAFETLSGQEQQRQRTREWKWINSNWEFILFRAVSLLRKTLFCQNDSHHHKHCNHHQIYDRPCWWMVKKD